VIKKVDPKPSDIWRDPVTGMEFVWVPGGCFRMGTPPDESGRENGEGPVHEVCVDGFWMGRHPVTNGQYRKYRPDHNSGDFHGHDLNGVDQPVVRVNWEDARAYAKWLTERKNGEYTYRLPTEAEWESACRAGTTTARFWGKNPDDACRYANVADQTAKRAFDNLTIHDCDDRYVVTSPVGSFRPNPLGIHDMLGNVWEWCQDVYSEDSYSEHSHDNPRYIENGPDRVNRGGSFCDISRDVRCGNRNFDSSGHRCLGLGFRLMRTASTLPYTVRCLRYSGRKDDLKLPPKCIEKAFVRLIW